MQESESESEKATVFGGIVNIGLYVVFDILASVLDKESVDLKVLVHENKPNSEIEPFIAVKRDNIEHK